MSTRNRLATLATLTLLALLPQPSHAMGNWLCPLAEVGSIAVGTVSMAVDTAFTINAIVTGVQGRDSLDPGIFQLQVGLMVPQLLLTGGGVLFNTQVCSDSKAAIVTEAIPLVWSIGLLGHGGWALSASAHGPAPTSQSLSMSTPAPLGSRMKLRPAGLGPRSIGLNLQGHF